MHYCMHRVIYFLFSAFEWLTNMVAEAEPFVQRVVIADTHEGNVMGDRTTSAAVEGRTKSFYSSKLIDIYLSLATLG